jgi:hypothetical protein
VIIPACPLAEDGQHWQSMIGRERLLAALAKGYIRHDLYVHKIWEDFGDVLAERYGPGMQQLAGEMTAPPQKPASGAAGGRRRGRSA